MKTIDFSLPGGFPTTTGTLDFMQQAYIPALKAAFADSGTNPVILSGMIANGPGTALSAGWCMIAGDLLYCPGGSMDPGFSTYITPQTTSTGDEFETGGVKQIYFTKEAVVVPGSNGIPPSGVLLSSFQHYAVGLIANVRTRIKTLTVPIAAVAGTTGSYTLKKDPWTGLVNFRGSFTVSNPSSLASGALPFYSFGNSQPEEYCPKDDLVFAALVRHHSYVPPLEDTGKDYIRQINCSMQGVTGSIGAGLLKAASAYTASFNITYPTW